MDLGLSQHVAIVTGASKGIGLAITKALAAEGAHVLAAARTTDTLAGLPGVTPVAADLTDSGAAGDLVRRAMDDHGRLDVLVNNVGAVRLRLDGFLALGDEDFQWALEMNFFTTLRMTRAALVPMVDQGRGVDRQHRIRQRVLPAGRRDNRLRRGQGSRRQPHEIAGAGVRAVGDPRQRDFPWTGRAPTCGWANTASPRRSRQTGVDADTARARVVAGIGGFATGRFTRPMRSPRCVVLLASDRTGERHGRERTSSTAG